MGRLVSCSLAQRFGADVLPLALDVTDSCYQHNLEGFEERVNIESVLSRPSIRLS